MTELADRTIAALSAHHDRLADVVGALDDDQLTGPSGAAQWRLNDVFSHLGSGAEIMARPLEAATSGEAPVEGDNLAIWDRWNAASPREQATSFVEHDTRMVDSLQALTAEQRDELRVDLGFLPEPVPLEVATGMRLSEVAQHTWDVLVGLDAQATLDEDAAEVLLDLFAGPLGFMLGFAGKPEMLSEPAVIDLLGRGLSIGEGVLMGPEAPVAPTATFVGSPEAAVRLLGGRLAPEHTPDGVVVTGNVTLDDLRRVFPGY